MRGGLSFLHAAVASRIRRDLRPDIARNLYYTGEQKFFRAPFVERSALVATRCRSAGDATPCRSQCAAGGHRWGGRLPWRPARGTARAATGSGGPAQIGGG